MQLKRVKIWRVCLLTLITGIFVCTNLNAQLPDLTDLAKEAGPAVVNISTVKTVKTSERLRKFFSPFKDHRSPFGDFFEKFFPDIPAKRKQHALGSGFIISEDGYVVTNAHVISKADKIEVNLQGSGTQSYKAKLVGKDRETDLALLKIDVEKDLPVLEFGDSQELEVGEWVLAIGNPFGLDHTVTSGIISAKGRVIGAGPYDNFLQTDASINPGNSGGPLLNLQGKVIGINSAIVAQGENIGFAIPSNMAKEVIKQLKKYHDVKRGWLGITIQDVDKNTAKALDLPEPKGALVASVKPGDPADKAGIQVGDVIYSVEGNPVEGANELTRMIGGMAPAREIEITLWRNREKKEVDVKLGIRDLQKAQKRQKQESSERRLLGMQVRQLSDKEARSLNISPHKGLVILDIKTASPADEANLRRGDVILRANGQPVSSRRQLKKQIQEASQKKVLMLFINRQGRNMFTTISWEEN